MRSARTAPRFRFSALSVPQLMSRSCVPPFMSRSRVPQLSVPQLSLAPSLVGRREQPQAERSKRVLGIDERGDFLNPVVIDAEEVRRFGDCFLLSLRVILVGFADA